MTFRETTVDDDKSCVDWDVWVNLMSEDWQLTDAEQAAEQAAEEALDREIAAALDAGELPF